METPPTKLDGPRPPVSPSGLTQYSFRVNPCGSHLFVEHVAASEVEGAGVILVKRDQPDVDTAMRGRGRVHRRREDTDTL